MFKNILVSKVDSKHLLTTSKTAPPLHREMTTNDQEEWSTIEDDNSVRCHRLIVQKFRNV